LVSGAQWNARQRAREFGISMNVFARLR
jgi:hypothetical protein